MCNLKFKLTLNHPFNTFKKEKNLQSGVKREGGAINPYNNKSQLIPSLRSQVTKYNLSSTPLPEGMILLDDDD